MAELKYGKALVTTRDYTIHKSDNPQKKYVAYLTKANAQGKRTVHFGDTSYQHFKDRIGLYSNLDHGDAKRRQAYYTRHGEAILHSAKWFSHIYLW